MSREILIQKRQNFLKRMSGKISWLVVRHIFPLQSRDQILILVKKKKKR